MEVRLKLLLVLSTAFCCCRQALAEKTDPNGYMVYCPCMGRFGNQADHFLGSLSFAKDINRTLILPPWIEYERGNPVANMVPFDTYFDVSALAEYHRVITMGKFMKTLSSTLWPPEKRIEFCWTPRQAVGSPDNKEVGCHGKHGNPFGPFWDYSSIDFVRSEYFYQKGATYDTKSALGLQKWRDNYPVKDYPVLAFVGAPAVFPVRERDVPLHKYLKWSSNIEAKVDFYINKVLKNQRFIGLHLRNGLDWPQVCEHLKYENIAPEHLFASPQCTGYGRQHGRLTMDVCNPSHDIIVQQVVSVVKHYGVHAVFVASDHDHMLPVLHKAVRPLEVHVFHREPNDPHVALAILARAEYYIGNCVSSFSAFAKRERDALGKPSGFWAWPPSAFGSKSKDKHTDNGREDL